jgi:hypothetical protein
MSRWVFNVNAVMEWNRVGRSIAIQRINTADERTINDIRWWRQVRLQDEHELQDHDEFRIGEFLGQGRRIQYCGPVHAMLEASKNTKFGNENATRSQRLRYQSRRQSDKMEAHIVCYCSIFLASRLG